MLRHKFRAKPCESDGIRFDSKLERKVYQDLVLKQKAGEIVGMLRQVPLHLPGKTKYVMDFLVFYSDGTCEGIEAKGFETDSWKIKSRLAAEIYPWLPIRIEK